MSDDLGDRMKLYEQAEAGRRSGVHQPTISAWLAGRRRLPIERLAALAQAVGVRLELRIVRPRRTDRPAEASTTTEN